jgi:hypothetical protein
LVRGDKTRALYSPGGHLKETYIDWPAELEVGKFWPAELAVGNFIDAPRYFRVPAAASLWTQQPPDGDATQEIQAKSPSESSSDSLEYESASSVKPRTSAPQLQPNTSLETAITAVETEPSPVSKPAPSPQQGGSRTPQSSPSSAPSITLAPESSPSRGLSGSQSLKPSESLPTLPLQSSPSARGRISPPVTGDQTLGLYIPGESGPIPLPGLSSTPFHTPIEHWTSEPRSAQAFGHPGQESTPSHTASYQENAKRGSPSVDGLVLESSHSESRGDEPGKGDGDAGGGGGEQFDEADGRERERENPEESSGDSEPEIPMVAVEAVEPPSSREGPELAAGIVESVANADADAQSRSSSHRSHPSQDGDSDAGSSERKPDQSEWRIQSPPEHNAS